MTDVDRVLAGRIVDFLNELLNTDRRAISLLFAQKFPCGERLADHLTVQVGVDGGMSYVRILGILNGLCGVDADGIGHIVAIFEYDRGPMVVRRFELYDPDRHHFKKKGDESIA